MKKKIINKTKDFLKIQNIRFSHKTAKEIFIVTFITINLHQINIKKFIRIFLKFRYPSFSKKNNFYFFK